ncbi:putative leucine-rich repeat-containing protein DDB_G0290503 isoform X2 [Mytilus edulis]|uniref:putative leucine-rich repeat-containing protein DDB_G0290503 isoform X2 n=1 Tax=Mytilus edulis TaxID=6550 RepID=UPI0039EE8F65
MKKKGVKRDKSKSIKQNRTEDNSSVREISVQTEETSPNLLYIASRLSTDDMGLYQSILSKDPVLPEVLMDGDDIQEEKKTRSIQESEQGENNSTYRVDDMSPKEPFTQRLFHRIPLRKTAPRGRAHVIQRTTGRTAQSNINANQETKHKSSETSGENILPSCSSFFNVDPQKGQSSFKNLESTVEVHDKISEQSWCRQKVRNGIDEISNTLTDNDVSSSLNSAAVIREYKKIIENRKTNILSHASLGIGTKSTVNTQDITDKSCVSDIEVCQGLAEQKKCMEERNNNSSYHVNSDTVKQDSPKIALPSLEILVASNTEESSPMIALSSLEKVVASNTEESSPMIALSSLETEVISNTEESSPMIALSSLETEVVSNTEESCEFDKERAENQDNVSCHEERTENQDNVSCHEERAENQDNVSCHEERAENQDNVSCHEERTENLGNVSCNLNSKIVEDDLHDRDVLEETVEDAKKMTNETVTKEPEVQKFVPLLSASIKTVKSKSESQSWKEQHNDNNKKELINVESKIKKNVKGKSVNQLSKKLHNDNNKKALLNVESKIKKNAKQKKNMNTDNSETVHKNTNLIAGSPIETGKEGIEKSSNCSNNAMLEGVASYKRWQHENLLKKKSFVSPKEDCNNNNKTCGKNGDNSIAIQNPHKKPCYTFDQKEDSGQNRNKQNKIKKCGQHQGDVFSIGGSDDMKGSENNNASSDSHTHLNSMSPILELQEPDVSLDNNCFKSLLPPLLRPTVTVEAEVHISMREMEKFQQKENSSVQGLHSNLSQSQNKQIQELLGQLDISDIVGTSGINSTPEKMTKGKIKKQKRKKPRMVNKGKEMTRTRHIRSCAPTVFYKKGTKKLRTGEKLDTQFANNLSKNDQLNHHFMEQEFGKVEKHESMTNKDIIEHTTEGITDVNRSSQKITTISAPPPVTGRIIRKNCIIMKRKRSKEEKISMSEPPLKLRKISSDENGACINNYSDEQPEIAALDQTIENDKSEERNAFLEDKESENIDVESSEILSSKTDVAEVYNEDKTGKEKDINKDVYWNHGAISQVEEGIVELQVDESDNIESGIGSDSDCNNRDGGDLNGEPDCVNVLGTNNNLEGQISTYGLDTKIDNILKRRDEDQESVDFEESRNVMNTGFKNSPHDDSFISECSSLSNENQVELNSEKHHDVNLHTADIEEMTDFIAGRIKEKAAKKHMKLEKIGRGAAGWEDSLRQKPKKTEIFQVNPAPQKLQSKDAQNSGSGNSELNERSKKAKRGRPRLHEKASGDHEIDPTLEIRTDHKLSDDSNFGQVVWGKLGRQRWWPAIVVEGYMVLRKQAEPGHSWLFWFGDHKITEVSRERIVPFVANFTRMYEGKTIGNLFKHGVEEAIKVCAERCNYNDSTNQLLDWASKGFLEENTSSPFDSSVFLPSKEKPLSDFVLEAISELRSTMRRNIDDSDDENDNLKPSDQGDALDEVKSKERKLEEICISCNDITQEVIHQHPLFVGGLCKECKQELIESFFAVGEDGTGMFCIVCSSGGKLFVCEESECNNVYCLECIRLFVGEDHVEKIKQADPWKCFLCRPYSLETHGYLMPKTDWMRNILRLYNAGYQVQEQDLSYLLVGEKKKLRVLSLFDGIGTGKVILDSLGLDVEVYYTSEIDQDSLLVTSFHYGDTVTPIGDVTKLTEEKLKEISPIDLVIGGSPCNDLSLANPVRKGFSDFSNTALLFFDYFRILRYVQNLSDGHHVFWLYENVASMRREYSDVISRFLQCQPALWDAKYFSAQARPRYFWGNIPGMYSTPDLSDIKLTADLDDILSNKCNRKATVKIIRTVTTRQNSLKQGKNDAFFPVTMNGKDDIIWISELERVFGFPDHYTDVGNIPVTKRRQMIGRAWSIPVVKKILNTLTDFFAVRNVEESPKV